MRRVEAVSRLLRRHGQAEPVLRALARDGLQKGPAFSAAQGQPQLVDDEQARLFGAMHVVPAHLRPHELLDQVQAESRAALSRAAAQQVPTVVVGLLCAPTPLQTPAGAHSHPGRAAPPG